MLNEKEITQLFKLTVKTLNRINKLEHNISILQQQEAPRQQLIEKLEQNILEIKKQKINEKFIDLCYWGKIGDAHYLLTSTSLPFNADIHASRDDESYAAFSAAARAGNLEVLQFLFDFI